MKPFFCFYDSKTGKNVFPYCSLTVIIEKEYG